MGRTAKPAALKKIDGNPGKRKINKKEINFVSDNLVNIKPPSDLTTNAKKMWNFIINEMPEELFKTVDLGELKTYCIAFDLHAQAYAKIKEQGLLVKSPVQGVLVQNAYLPILNKQAEMMIKCASNLGLTPTARAKLQLPEKKEKNIFEDL